MPLELSSPLSTGVDPAQLEEVVHGTRLVAAVIAESLAGLEPAVTAPQWRVLVLAHAGGCNVTGVAADLGVHVSNATRTCDRLVAAGLLERRRAEHDKRHVLLALTPSGRRLFDRAMEHRRRRLRDAMALMDPEDRAQLAHGLTQLVRAAAVTRGMNSNQQGADHVPAGHRTDDRHPPG